MARMPQMPIEKAILIAGLGNPGSAYEHTRHNAGWMVIDRFAERYKIPLSKKTHRIAFGRGSVEGKSVILAKPLVFVNRSGVPVQRLAHYYKISVQDLLVIHDDLDLAYGRLKAATNRSAGGHRGIKSLFEAFSSSDFMRLRIGINRPADKMRVINHVLGKFTAEEQKRLAKIIDRAVEGIRIILQNGIKEAMNRINNRKFLIF